MRRVILVVIVAVALALAGAAGAVPPSVLSVGSQARHPTITFSAPKSDHVVVEIASKPDRASDGEFLSENRVVFDVMTDSEIQTGRWLYDSQLDPGTYYVLLRASPDFDPCYVGSGSYDPSCANGYSDLATLTIPKPRIKYAVEVTRETFLGSAELRIVATPLGEKLPYRVCYRTKAGKNQCLSGTLAGYSWNAPADDRLSVKTRNLSTFTTFTWFVGGQNVASKRVRVR